MRLYLDACAIIYAIEGAEPFHSAVLRRVKEVESLTGGVLLTSRLSLLECRVKPIRQNNTELLSRYNDFFTRTKVEIVEISSAVIDRATTLRAALNFKTADSIHVATAHEAHADVFLTGDASLARCPDVRVDVL
jgi:predicted nucleic acid-binding protein